MENVPANVLVLLPTPRTADSKLAVGQLVKIETKPQLVVIGEIASLFGSNPDIVNGQLGTVEELHPTGAAARVSTWTGTAWVPVASLAVLVGTDESLMSVYSHTALLRAVAVVLTRLVECTGAREALFDKLVKLQAEPAKRVVALRLLAVLLLHDPAMRTIALKPSTPLLQPLQQVYLHFKTYPVRGFISE
jgi:hypothetical protein